MMKTMRRIMLSFVVFMLVSGASFITYAMSLDELDVRWIENSDDYLYGLSFLEDGRIFYSKSPVNNPYRSENGFIDKNGKFLSILPYKYTQFFSEGLCAVAKDGKWGYINSKGDVVIDFQFDDCGDFYEGLAYMEQDGKYGFIDKMGKIVIKSQFKEARNFHEGIAMVALDGGWGYINTKGELVVPAVHDYLADFSDGLGRVVDFDTNKTIYFDKNGKIVLEFAPNEIYGEAFSEGLASFSKIGSDDVGYINKKGEVVIEPQYGDAWQFKEDLAVAKDTKTKKYGYINREGEWVIKPQFERAHSFDDGWARVDVKDYFDKPYQQVLEGIIDKEGNYIVKPSFQSIYRISDSPKWIYSGTTSGEHIRTGIIVLTDKRQNSVFNNQRKAIVSKQELFVDVKMENGLAIYNIEGHNYFKLRDIAMLARGKKAQFSLNWDGEKQLISLVKGGQYQPNGSELVASDGKDKMAMKSRAKLMIDGEVVSLSAYNIGGQNYYQLRELATALDFKVDWDDKQKQIIVTMD